MVLLLIRKQIKTVPSHSRPLQQELNVLSGFNIVT